MAGRRDDLIRVLSFGRSVEDGCRGGWQLPSDNCHLFDIVDRKSARACFGCPLRLWAGCCRLGSYEVLKSLTFGLTGGSCFVCWGFAPVRDGVRRDQASEGHLVDALAPRGDEGRGTLRKAAGSCEQALIRGSPNGETRPFRVIAW